MAATAFVRTTQELSDLLSLYLGDAFSKKALDLIKIVTRGRQTVLGVSVGPPGEEDAAQDREKRGR